MKKIKLFSIVAAFVAAFAFTSCNTGDDNNSNYQLNGKWRFQWSADPGKRPADFYKNDFNTDTWDTIEISIQV